MTNNKSTKLYAIIYTTEDFESKGNILDVDGLWTEYDSQGVYEPETIKVEFIATNNIEIYNVKNREEMEGNGFEPEKYDQFEAMYSRPWCAEVREATIVELDDGLKAEIDGGNAWHNLEELAQIILEQGEECGRERRIFLPHNTFNKIEEEE